MQNNDLISRMGVLLSLPLFDKGQNGYPLNGGIQYARAMIEAAPSMDAEFVRHGRWIFGTANHREWMKCSVCLKSQTPTGVFTYCPNCGAKMDGKDDT